MIPKRLNPAHVVPKEHPTELDRCTICFEYDWYCWCYEESKAKEWIEKAIDWLR